MHKSDDYGVILLKQKDKQADKQIKNFALKLARFMPYNTEEIMAGLIELLEADVIQNGDDKLMQKRMVHDNEISEVRSKAGKKGGLKTQNFAKAKIKANTENENENENEIISEVEIIKEEYKGKAKKNLESRETIFVSEVWQYKEQYTDEMLKNFINYWTETNKSKTKMLWETKPTFEISKRLVTWASRDNEFNNKSNSLLSESDRQRLKESGIYGKT
jgi:hypothetical protein